MKNARTTTLAAVADASAAVVVCGGANFGGASSSLTKLAKSKLAKKAGRVRGLGHV